MKNILMIMALISISACTYADADEWPDKECNEYSAYIGFLAGHLVLLWKKLVKQMKQVTKH